MADDPLASSPDQRSRVVIRLHADTRERVAYWAKARGYSSANEYIAAAVEEQIKRENGDYDLPTLEIARVNQLVDQTKGLAATVENLRVEVSSGMSSLLKLTRGDNYLIEGDPQDGEL